MQGAPRAAGPSGPHSGVARPFWSGNASSNNRVKDLLEHMKPCTHEVLLGQSKSTSNSRRLETSQISADGDGAAAGAGRRPGTRRGGQALPGGKREARGSASNGEKWNQVTEGCLLPKSGGGTHMERRMHLLKLCLNGNMN